MTTEQLLEELRLLENWDPTQEKREEIINEAIGYIECLRALNVEKHDGVLWQRVRSRIALGDRYVATETLVRIKRIVPIGDLAPDGDSTGVP